MGLKICMGGKTHRYYKHTKFRQNPRGNPKFLINLTWNDSYRNACNVFFRDLPVSSFVFHSSLLTVKSISSVVARDGFLCVTKIVHRFHGGYLDIRFAFQTVLDLYCCVTS